MAERDSEKRGPLPVLWVGAGRRAHELGAVLGALALLDAEGARAATSHEQRELEDLEQLLAARAGTSEPSEGIVILEAARVPPEDIGFVRRFLERRPGWRAVVVGDPAQEGGVSGLRALARVQWLAWPPDLDELRALLKGAGAAQSAGTAAREERRGARRAVNGSAGGVEVAALLEELLAGSALTGEGTPRFQLRAGERFVLQRERAALVEGFGGLLELARACAGDGGLVRGALEAVPGALRVVLDFPRAGLKEKELSGLLERAATGDAGAGLAKAVNAARSAAALLREGGDDVQLAAEEGGRVRCEIRLVLGGAGEKRRVRVGKAEDPFA